MSERAVREATGPEGDAVQAFGMDAAAARDGRR